MSKRQTRLTVSIAAVAAIGMAGYWAPLIKQRMLPTYATPDKIESLFREEIAALRDVAEGGTTPDDVSARLSDEHVLGACVVTSYDGGLIQIKEYAPEWYDATGSGIWCAASPGLDTPVVNIWGDRVAVYERKFRTADGAVRGILLAVDVGYLKQQN